MKQNKYRIKLAYGAYRVGQIIEPNGLWRDLLLSRGFIEPYVEAPLVEVSSPETAEVVAGPKAEQETVGKRRRGKSDDVQHAL